MAITSWSPLAGGFLTGKFNPGADAAAREGARLSSSPRGAQLLEGEKIAIAQALAAQAVEIGCSSAQLALAWQMQRSAACVIPIIGARKLSQLEDNLGAVDVRLDAEQIERLDALTALETEYPQSLFKSDFFQTMMYGEVRERIVT
jgi:aryl-alcohol dehydrogenase-like predicted oxidoreductase